jgi:uncharacterized protein DUF4412
MKKSSSILALAILGFGLVPAYAQSGALPGGPQFNGVMSRLFGNNRTFTADLEMRTRDSSGDAIVIPGKITFDSDQSRFEADMTQLQTAQMTPEAAEQMKFMDLNRIVMIRQPDKKIAYLLYPGMRAYVESPLQDPAAAAGADDFKVETTELGRETVDGHPCVNSKVVITDKQGTPHEFTIWNAADLKNFPVKIYQAGQDNNATLTLTFKNIAFAKPDPKLFVPPPDYTKYDSPRSMIRSVMMQHMGGGSGSGTFNPLAH